MRLLGRGQQRPDPLPTVGPGLLFLRGSQNAASSQAPRARGSPGMPPPAQQVETGQQHSRLTGSALFFLEKKGAKPLLSATSCD